MLSVVFMMNVIALNISIPNAIMLIVVMVYSD
jgi:hypothetical protein